MEARLFDPANPPEWTTAEWYANRETAPHLEQEGHRERLLLTAEFCQTAARLGAASAFDFGAGDGGLLSLIKPSFEWVYGADLQRSNVNAAYDNRGIDLWHGDVLADEELVPVADLAVATEFLEHLVDPHGFLRRQRERGFKWLVASSPYTETESDHYAHHCWVWDVIGYQKMLHETGWTPVRTDMAWICQVVLAERKP